MAAKLKLTDAQIYTLRRLKSGTRYLMTGAEEVRMKIGENPEVGLDIDLSARHPSVFCIDWGW